VTSIGAGLSIRGNISLTSFTGLENLTSIGWGLSVWGNDAMICLTGLDNLTSIGGNIKIYQNNALNSLTGLGNLTSIGGSLYVGDNNALISLTGLENIAPGSIGNLSVYSNSALSNCAVESICDYLAAPNGSITIHDNAPGCNSQAEVEEACLHIGIGEEENNKIPEIEIYPSPVNDFATLQFQSDQACNGLIEIFNATGVRVQSRQLQIDNAGQQHLLMDFTALPRGIYFCRVQSGGEMLTKKIVKQ
jgi:hypothetical protein